MYWGLIIPIHYNPFIKLESKLECNDIAEIVLEIKPTPTTEVQINDIIEIKPTLTPSPTPKATHKISRGNNINGVLYRVTAYDLSIDSCGKPRYHKYFGITSSGFNLANHTRESAMTIDVDTNIIPMFSKVWVDIVNDKYKHMNGIYIARDTGGAIKGNIIDIFMGDFYSEKAHNSVWEFGIQNAYITVMEDYNEWF